MGGCTPPAELNPSLPRPVRLTAGGIALLALPAWLVAGGVALAVAVNQEVRRWNGDAGYFLSISRAQLYPAAPMTPPPGCAPAPHRYRPRIGVR